LLAGRLGGADLKIAIERDRIATDNFSCELLRKLDGERGLAGRSRPKNYNQQRVGLRRCSGGFTGTACRACFCWGGQRAPQGVVLPKRRNASARMNSTMTNSPTSFIRSRER